MFRCGSVICIRKYKHPRIHPCAHKHMQPTSVAQVCCLNSGTHRLNNSRLSLLSLLAASSVDLHNKHTETNIISPLPLHHPHLQDQVFATMFFHYFSPVHNTHRSQQAALCRLCRHNPGLHRRHRCPNRYSRWICALP